jgi:hypothetical protein
MGQLGQVEGSDAAAAATHSFSRFSAARVLPKYTVGSMYSPVNRQFQLWLYLFDFHLRPLFETHNQSNRMVGAHTQAGFYLQNQSDLTN